MDKKLFGFVSIIGETNAGKSTLLNNILNEKVSIITHRKNTTRRQIQGIYNDDQSQIVFLDTPGFIKVKNKLDQQIKGQILSSIEESDVLLYLLPFWKKDNFNNIDLKEIKAKKFLLITQIDKADSKKLIYQLAKNVQELNLFDEIIPISSLKNINLNTLIEEIKKDLNLDYPYYPIDKKQEQDDGFFISEIIREKIMILINNEIPYNLFVDIKKIKDESKILRIEADILVESLSIKKIMIGNNAKQVKRIGTLARRDLERHFNKQVYLGLNIKLDPKKLKNKDLINI